MLDATPGRLEIQQVNLTSASNKTPSLRENGKMLKKLGIVLALLAGLLAVLALIIAARPAEFSLQRSITMDAPPEAPFKLVNNFRHWEQWSPWAKLDPEISVTFEGPEEGAGAVYTWSGNNDVGEGKMTIVESRSPEQVGIQLEFIKPMKATNTTEFSFTPEGDQTVVTWTMAGQNNFMGKAFGLFMDIESIVGAQFEQGLADMKAAAEAAPQQ